MFVELNKSSNWLFYKSRCRLQYCIILFCLLAILYSAKKNCNLFVDWIL